MKRLFALPLMILSLATVAAQTEQAPQGDRNLLEINGQYFNESHFLAFAVQQGSAEDLKSQKTQAALLNKLANTAMVAQAAEKAKLDEHPQIKAAIEMARIQVLAEVQITSYLASHQATEEEIKSAYERQYSGDNLVEYKASHILVQDEQQAKDIIQALAGGADFASLAKENSLDASKDQGGNLGWFGRKQVVKQFGDAVAALDKGQLTEQPVQSPFGWHVILLEDKRTQTPPPLEDVKDQLAAGLSQQHLSDYLRQLREESTVRVIEPDPVEQTTAE